MPPTRKKKNADVLYMRPSFLWSTVKAHDFQPVVATGRRYTPRALEGVTNSGAMPDGTAGTPEGRSMIAIYALPYFRSIR
jgi:hypothetical protein